MFLARDYFLGPPRGAATFGELWALAELARGRAAAGMFASPHLSLQDNREGTTSAVSRFRKAFPSLVPYASLNALEPVGDDMPLQAGEEIFAQWSEFAAGVPRRFPTGWCVLTLPWHPDIAPMVPHPLRGVPRPGQDTHPSLCGFKVSRRGSENWLALTVPLVIDPSDPSSAPAPPPGLADVATSIAPVRWKETRCILGGDEFARRQRSDEQIRAALRDGKGQMMRTGRAAAPPVPGDVSVRSFRRHFEALARRNGYAYRGDLSQRRYHTAAKVSPGFNSLHLVLDVGGIGPSIDLRVLSLGFPDLFLPLLPPSRIEGDGQWRETCLGLDEPLKILEQSFFTRVEALAGGSPPWFAGLERLTVRGGRTADT